ncbi:MAG: NAD(P)-binding domain-containing protein, partial [Candidatus Rokuibacteriota bacterium]
MIGDHAARLARKLDAGRASIAVVGLGYVGLSLAVALARTGFRVCGIEVNLEKVSLLN